MLLILVIVLLMLARGGIPVVMAHPLTTLAPGHWYATTGTTLKQVGYPWPVGIKYTINGVGLDGVISSWSGGAYDDTTQQLLIFGGGHYAYAGNEVYAFALASMQWQRLSDPGLRTDASNTLWQSGEYPDAQGQPDPTQPRSNHTYNTLQMVPGLNQLCNLGTPGVFPAAGSSLAVHCFDRTAARWQRKAPMLGSGLQAWSAVDDVTGHVWTHGTNTGLRVLQEWDPLADTWTIRSRQNGRYVTANSTAAIDPVRRLLVVIGGGQTITYDLAQPGLLTPQVLTVTGDPAILQAPGPGLDYSPRCACLVAWSGGTDVYVLDLDTKAWRRVAPTPGNTVFPLPAHRNGTYGRWRYSATYNVFLVVSGITQPVYFYKLP